MKLTKKQFIAILDFLSEFGGLTDLCEIEMQEELWEHYKNERNN